MLLSSIDRQKRGKVQFMSQTLVVAQLGAPTAVINQTLVGIVEEARSAGFDKVLGARNGVLGILKDEFYDLSAQPAELLDRLRRTPGSALGSCRYSIHHDSRERNFRQICQVFKARKVDAVIFIGGNGTMAALREIAAFSRQGGHEIKVMGAAKTIDNDLFGTDHAPGYGSIAKFIGTAVQEAGRDNESLCTFETCSVTEVMGRDTGWIAAASALAAKSAEDAPHIILVPELLVNWDRLRDRIRGCVQQFGRCAIVATEGLRGQDGKFLSPQKPDPSGQMQFSGVGQVLADYIQDEMGLRCRYNRPGAVQRNAVHLASLTDAVEADAIGRQAVLALAAGDSGHMVSIFREQGPDYHIEYGMVDLGEVAGEHRPLPPEYIDEDGIGVSEAFMQFIRPLVKGRVEWTEGDNGLPVCTRLTGGLLPQTAAGQSGDK